MLHNSLKETKAGLHRGVFGGLVALVLGLCVLSYATPAAAICCDAATCDCIFDISDDEVNEHTGKPEHSESDGIETWQSGEFGPLQKWMIEIMFLKHILPAMMQVTDQISAVALYQVSVIGPFLDAKHQMETQRLFQYMKAQTHDTYVPAEELCTMGTAYRSLMASEERIGATSAYLSQNSIKRQVLSANRNAATGPLGDREGRMTQFRTKYCDKLDNNGQFEKFCGSSVAPERRNRDIDYTRSFANDMTLDVDFNNEGPTQAEEDLMALASNLYSHEVFPQFPEALLKGDNSKQEVFMNARSLVAKRSVAEQSFYDIAALRSRGVLAEENKVYLVEILKEVGFPQEEAEKLIGENPSYLAQLDLLARRMFQRPEFYVSLIDKPANVARRGVAMQTIGLMQKRELFKSAVRSEAMISILLELGLMDEQDTVLNRANAIQ